MHLSGRSDSTLASVPRTSSLVTSPGNANVQSEWWSASKYEVQMVEALVDRKISQAIDIKDWCKQHMAAERAAHESALNELFAQQMRTLGAIQVRLNTLSTSQAGISSTLSRQQDELDRVRPSLNAALVLWKQLQLQVSNRESSHSLARSFREPSKISPDDNILERIENIEESLTGLITGVAEVLTQTPSSSGNCHRDSRLLDAGGNDKHVTSNIESIEKRMSTLETSTSFLKLEFTAREELYRSYATATTRALTELVAVGSEGSAPASNNIQSLDIGPSLAQQSSSANPSDGFSSTYPASARQEESSIKRELSHEFDNAVEKQSSSIAAAATQNLTIAQRIQLCQQNVDRQSEALETLRLEFDTLRLNHHGELLDVAKLMQNELEAMKREFEQKISLILSFVEDKLTRPVDASADTSQTGQVIRNVGTTDTV